MSLGRSNNRAARNSLFLCIALNGALAILAAPAFSASEILTTVPPPPDRVEHAPPRRDGYVWGAGHWEWNGRAYAWISGTWLVERRAAHWVVARWEQVGS